MHRLACLAAVVLTMWALDSWGYGGSPAGGKTCRTPVFAEFNPPDKAEVKPGSQFSFLTWSILPETLKVTVKGQPIKVIITAKGSAFLVSGTLPEQLRNTYARITLSAYGPGRCRGTAGWLVKISD